MNGASNGHCGQMNGSCNGAAATNGCCNGAASENPQNGHGTKKKYETELKCVDGNWAVAHAAYRTNDCAYIFPITPSSVSQKILRRATKILFSNLTRPTLSIVAHGRRSRCLGGTTQEESLWPRYAGR